jgi:uncharacterized protein YjiS (DUF1127 family)
MFGFLNRCNRRIAKRRQHRASARALAALDDRQLKDIGIYSGQISAVSAGQDPRLEPSRNI